MTRVPDQQKMYFKIGEVSELSGIKPHVLRYWETEFNVAKPMRSKAQQRVYKRSDVEKILLIKRLLYEEKYSIAGAKKRLQELVKQRKAEEPIIAAEPEKHTQPELCFDERRLKNKLKEIKSLLIHLKESL